MTRKRKQPILVSKLAYEADLSQDVIYRDHRGILMAHSPSLGCLYDRPLYSKYLNQTILPDVTNILKQVLSGQAEDNEPVTVPSSTTGSIFDKQASMFLQLLDELQYESESKAVMMLPAFSALVACLKSGWRPKSVAKVRCYLGH